MVKSSAHIQEARKATSGSILDAKYVSNTRFLPISFHKTHQGILKSARHKEKTKPVIMRKTQCFHLYMYPHTVNMTTKTAVARSIVHQHQTALRRSRVVHCLTRYDSWQPCTYRTSRLSHLPWFVSFALSPCNSMVQGCSQKGLCMTFKLICLP